MNHTEFFKRLKANELLPAYLFHGEEEFVKESAYSQLVQTIVPENRDFNVTLLDTDSAQEIADSCETLPFMCERRLVVNRRIPTDKNGAALADYLTRIPSETVLLIYIQGNADAKTSVVKKLRALGGEVVFAPLDDAEILRWIKSRAKKADLTISQDAARYFLQLVGRDMLNVSNEMQKLVSACSSGEITRELIADIVTSNIEYKNYTMFQAFMNGNFSEGFSQLDAILDINPEDDAISVAGYILSCFKNMLAVYDLLASGETRPNIMSRLKLKDYTLRGIEQNLHGFSREIILKAIARFSDITYLKIAAHISARDALTDAVCAVFMRSNARDRG